MPMADEPLGVAEVASRFLRHQFNGAAELFTRLFIATHLGQQFAKVEKGCGVAGILAEPGQIMLPGRLQLSLAPERLGNPHLHIRMGIVQIERLLPAVDRLVVEPAHGQRATHVVIAMRAMFLVEPGKIEHFLRVLVIAKLGIADQLKPKTIIVSGRPVGAAVASGEAEIGIQQVAELVPVPGVTLVGPLPADVNRIIGYSVGIPSKAKEMDAAKAFAKFIASGEALAAYKQKGMEPAS